MSPTLFFDLDEFDDDDDLYDDEALKETEEPEPDKINLIDIEDEEIYCKECGSLVEDGFQCQICGLIVEK